MGYEAVLVVSLMIEKQNVSFAQITTMWRQTYVIHPTSEDNKIFWISDARIQHNVKRLLTHQSVIVDGKLGNEPCNRLKSIKLE
jgi:hypothetical protein